MSDITIVSNEYITIKYLPDKNIIYHTIRKPVSGKPLREALDQGTEALNKYGATKWLSDDRNNGPLPPEDAQWGFESWNRRTLELGWKYWAIVVPKQLEDAGTMIPVIDTLYNLGLRVMVFSNLEDAFAWLDSVE